MASICRLHALYIVDITKDMTWDNPGTAIWSAIELNVGILCASLPTLRAFFNKVWPRAFLSTFNSRRVGADTENATKGQYYNMEGSIMVKKTIAIQNVRAVDGDEIEGPLPHSSSNHEGGFESIHLDPKLRSGNHW